MDNQIQDHRLQQLNNLKGKYIKQALQRLEVLNAATPQVRKVVLDEMNDLMRDVQRELGYDIVD